MLEMLGLVGGSHFSRLWDFDFMTSSKYGSGSNAKGIPASYLYRDKTKLSNRE